MYGLKQPQESGIFFLKKSAKLVTNVFMLITAYTYMFRVRNIICFLAIYVDDMGLLGNDLHTIEDHKRPLSQHFKIKDLGEIKQLPGIGIGYNQEAGTLSMTQTRYIEESLKKLNIFDNHSHPTPLNSGIKLSKDDCSQTDEEK